MSLMPIIFITTGLFRCIKVDNNFHLIAWEETNRTNAKHILSLRLDSHDKSFELCFLSKVFSFQAIKWYQIYRLYRLIKWWLASKQHHFVILCVLFYLLNFTYIGIFVRKYHILPQICCYNCFWSINKMRIKLYLWCTKFIFLGKPR